MPDPFTAWSRMMTAAMTMGRTSQQMAETLTASKAVVATRTKLIEAALASPLTADHAELGRMVPEKVAAFAKSGQAIGAGWWALQSALLAEANTLGTLALRGRAPTLAELATLTARQSALGLSLIEGATATGAAALAPVHKTATANAKRLKRR